MEDIRKELQMKLLLARHGETDWNVRSWIQGSTDIPLNGRGKEQARQLAESLVHRQPHIGAIYSSGLERARQTAAVVSWLMEVPYKVEPGLEEFNLGSWEGKTWKQVRSVYTKEYENWHQNRRYTRIPKGESYQDLLDRLVPALRRIAEREQSDTLIVTHSACIMTLFSYINDTPFEDMVKLYHTENGGVYELEGERILAL